MDIGQSNSVPAGDDKLEAWASAGRGNQGGLEVLWHANHTVLRGGRIEDCPFGHEATGARERWEWMFKRATRAKAAREAEALEAAMDEEPDQRGQWWMEI